MMSNNKSLILMTILIVGVCAIVLTYYGANTKINEESLTKEQIVEDLIEVNLACEEYYEQVSKERDLLSVAGGLYDDKFKSFITIDDIIESSNLKVNGNILDAEIFYLKPDDVSIVAENIEKGQELRIFISVPFGDDYIISSVKDAGSIITDESYRELVLYSSMPNGDIRNPKLGTDDFNGIIKTMNDYYDKKLRYDIKHITCDDLYACIVIQDLARITEIKGFILERKNDSWEIIMDDLAELKSIRKTVNSRNNKIGIDLLPLYDIAEFGEITLDFDMYINALIQQEMITEADFPITYLCGVEGSFYIELSSELKFICLISEDNELTCYDVETPVEAISILAKSGKNPMFIIKMGETMIS